MLTATNKSGIACYYGDNDFITQTFDFIAPKVLLALLHTLLP